MFPFALPAVAPAKCLASALLSILLLGIGSAAQAQTVTLDLSQDSIAENDGSATVTATVSPASPTPFTVEVSAQAFAGLVPQNGRIVLSPNTTLAFEANETSSPGTVTITALDNDGHTDQFRGGVTVKVEGTASGGTGVTGPEDVELTIVEDDGIGNPGDRTGPEPVQTPDGYGGTVSESRMVLTFSEPLKTNRLDEHSFRYRVNGGRYLAPDSAAINGSSVIVTLREPVEKGDIVTTRYLPPPVGVGNVDIFLDLAVQDEAGNPLYRINRINLRNDSRQRVKLALAPATIYENGGKTTVTATVPEAQAAPFTVTVAVSSADRVELSSNTVLSFAANATTSTGEVTVAAIDNDIRAANPEVTVSGAVIGTFDVWPPFDAMLAIRDDEMAPLPTGAGPDVPARAWLARFGRTVADQVTDSITERLKGAGGPQVTVGGQSLTFARTGNRGGAGSTAGVGHAWNDTLFGNARPYASGVDGAHTLTERDLLLGSSFRLDLAGDEAAARGTGRRWTAWGRGAATRFDGEAEGYSLDGDVNTVTLGADAAQGRWLAGLALARSIGAGGYRGGADTTERVGRSSGKAESSSTSVHPYLRLQASEHFSFWGTVGYGNGALMLKSDDTDNRRQWKTDTEIRIAAAGARGLLLPAKDTGDFELAAITDVRLVRMSSAATTGKDGTDGLAATKTETGRVRLVMEGSQRFELEDGRTLTPSLEIGLRHDGGDAETGAGIAVGGGVRYADPRLGLTVEATAGGLVAHEDADYTEWGAGGSVRIDPGAAGRGLSFGLSPAWGAAPGGTGLLRSRRDAGGLAANDRFHPAGSLKAETGYGLTGFGGRGAMTPFAALALSEAGGRTWRSGIRWTLGPHIAFGIEGTRREAANKNAPDHGIAFRATARL